MTGLDELNEDFRDMILALADEGAEFLIVGAYAVSFHGYARTTGDIDLLTGISGVTFEAAWQSRVEVEWADRRVAFLALPLLLENKRSAGRPKDLLDAEELQKIERERKSREP